MNKIIIVDRSINIRNGIENIINSINGYSVSLKFLDLAEMKKNNLSGNEIVLFELTEENLNIFENVFKMKSFNTLKFIGLTSLENLTLEKEGFIKGINGIISKSSSRNKFAELFRVVNSGGLFFTYNTIQTIRKDSNCKEDSTLKQKLNKIKRILKS